MFFSLTLPFWLITGPFLPDLILSLYSIFFIIFSIKKKNYYYFQTKIFKIFFIFCSIIILSTCLSDNIFLSFESSLFYFRFGVFSCLVFYLIDKSINFLRYFYYCLLITFLILIFDGYFQYINKLNIFANELHNNYRVTSFFDRPKLGSYLSRTFPLLLALLIFFNERKRYISLIISIMFLLVSTLVLLTGERVSFFYIVFGYLFIQIFTNRINVTFLISFLIFITTIFILIYSSTELKKRFIDRTVKQITYNNKYYIFSPNHDSHIRTAFNMFLDKPILGHGPKMFRVKCSDPKYAVGINPCSAHPHNFYVQLLAETGIIGFSFLFSAFCYVLYSAYRQLKSIVLKETRYLTDYQVCLLAGILITVWPFSPNGNFFNNWLAIVYSLPIGFYLQSIYSKKIRNYKKPA